MKISLNTAQYFSNVDIKAIGHEQLVEKIGAQLGAVEETINWAPKFEGIVIARVASCVDHPNADKLHVCKVDDGGAVKDVERDENGFVQVVCGAPNVREGLIVAWIPPGSIVPTTYGTDEPFVLTAKELRGVISNGMLASAAELGISDNHDGLLEINEAEVTPGQPFVSLYGLDDFVIDVENKMFTHRPDCFGVLGIAREIAGITNQSFLSPSWYVQQPQFASATGLPLSIRVDVPALCPRFMAVAIKDVHVKPSPVWLQAALTRIGIRPINNIVDMTNWIMYVTGQPTHAYDYDKVATRSANGAEIIVRQPKSAEKLVLINGKTIEPRAEAVVIASSNELIGLAGMMGGGDTEVDDDTKNIIVEVANFDMYSIRRSSMHHGLFTDAVTRFNKGQSPHQNDRVLAYLMEQIFVVAGGAQASDVCDVRTDLPENPRLQITSAFINERLGLDLVANEMAAILRNVEFEVAVNDDNIVVTAPFWRTDIMIAEDIVEEIGRLYGFDHLPLVLPPRLSEPTHVDEMLQLKSAIRHMLSRAGANEVLGYSFVHGDLLKKAGQDATEAFGLSNALSPNLQYYRLSLTPSLLEKVHPNQKAGFDTFALFELGKVHRLDAITDEGIPSSLNRLALVYASSDKQAHAGSGAAYFSAENMLDYVLKELSVNYELQPIGEMVPPYDAKRSAQIVASNGTILGVVGEYTMPVITALKLPKYCAGFELNTDVLLQNVSNESHYVPLPKFPKVSQDLSLKVASDIPFAALYTLLQASLAEIKPNQTWVDLMPLDIYTASETTKHISFRLQIASYERTLTAEEVNDLLNSVAETAKKQLGTERI